MRMSTARFSVALTLSLAMTGAASAQVACSAAGPQTPRDIASALGTNATMWEFAPASTEMNLCNIHTHTNAEHKGPGFMVVAEAMEEDHGGFKCNETADLTEAELAEDHSGGHTVKPGETIEVHWVHTTCEAMPGKGLGVCLPEGCENPQVRVETQVFLVVNNHDALNFSDFTYDGNMAGDLHQPKALPDETGDPVVFLGSTTGPSYNSADKCSPVQVTWSVRPQCAKVDVASVNAWYAEHGDEMGARMDGSMNVFKEDHSHGVRQLVTDAALLSPIGQ